MAKLRRKARPEESFQMTPMIDMVFLLLVFFMCVSTLAQADKNVALDLAESQESKVPEDLSDRGIISLNKDGSIFLRSRSLALEEMKEQIKATLQRNPELEIQLRVDRETRYADVKKVLEACAEAGAYKVIYSTIQASS